jgi:hypothetical protein
MAFSLFFLLRHRVHENAAKWIFFFWGGKKHVLKKQKQKQKHVLHLRHRGKFGTSLLVSVFLAHFHASTCRHKHANMLYRRHQQSSNYAIKMFSMSLATWHSGHRDRLQN